MIKHILLAFIVLLASIFLGIQLQANPGYVLIALDHWTIETTLWAAVFLLILLLLALCVVIGLIYRLIHIPSTVSRWYQKHQVKKAQKKTSLKLLIDLYQQNKDWPKLIALLPILKKYKVLAEKEFESLQLRVYLFYLDDLVHQGKVQAAIKCFAALPKSLKSNPELVAQYAGFLLGFDKSERSEGVDYLTQAESLLRACLNKQFDERLIELYGLLPCKDYQLAFAESLLKKNAHSCSLHLCLGRFYKEKQLWGKAKYHLEQALQFTPKPVIYKELGMLHELLNNPTLACAHYKKGLILKNSNTFKQVL